MKSHHIASHHIASHQYHHLSFGVCESISLLPINGIMSLYIQQKTYTFAPEAAPRYCTLVFEAIPFRGIVDCTKHYI